jgi:transposase
MPLSRFDRAIDLARQPGVSVAQVAEDLGTSESGLRRWMSQDDINAGRREGLTSDERADLVRLRRDLALAGQPLHTHA